MILFANQVVIGDLIPIAIVLLAISIFLTIITYKSHKRRAKTGKEHIIGSIARVTKKINPEGKVSLEGEIWNAFFDGIINKGEQVEVIDIKGMNLKVKKIDNSK